MVGLELTYNCIMWSVFCMDTLPPAPGPLSCPAFLRDFSNFLTKSLKGSARLKKESKYIWHDYNHNYNIFYVLLSYFTDHPYSYHWR